MRAQLVRQEVEGSQLAQKSRRAEARERQRKANKKASRKRAGGSGKNSKQAKVTWDGIMPLSEFAERLAKEM